MTCRDQTARFIAFRDAAIRRRAPRPSFSSTPSQQRQPLLNDDSLTSTSSSFSSSLRERSSSQRPFWMSMVDESKADLSLISRKLKELEALQQEGLVVNFDDDDNSTELAIDSLSQKISTLFRGVQTRMLEVKRMEIDGGAAERRMRENIVGDVFASMRKLLSVFRDKQKKYLSEMKSLDDGDVFEIETAKENVQYVVDRGFSPQLVSKSNALHNSIVQRNEDIIKLAKSIEEIADLMQELSTLVDVQGTILDRIEYNCETTLQNVKKGTANLKTANEGASKSSMKARLAMLGVAVLTPVVASIIILKTALP